MKIGVIGADGQLGFDLADKLSNQAEIIKWTIDDFDVTDKKGTFEKIKNAAPNVVINTAAFHKVIECESDPNKSFMVNAVGASHVASAAASVGAKIIFISTDYVFGNSKSSYVESDGPNPLNVYGASKLAGEQLTRIANPGAYYIVRTSALFGEHQSGKGHNFVTLMLKLTNEGREIKVVDDQYTAPTYTKDLVEAIQKIVFNKIPPGVYHVTNQGSASWFKFAQKIFEYAGLSPNLKPISFKEQREALVRPQSSVLKSEALSPVGINFLRPWQEALKEYMALMK